MYTSCPDLVGERWISLCDMEERRKFGIAQESAQLQKEQSNNVTNSLLQDPGLVLTEQCVAGDALSVLCFAIELYAPLSPTFLPLSLTFRVRPLSLDRPAAGKMNRQEASA